MNNFKRNLLCIGLLSLAGIQVRAEEPKQVSVVINVETSQVSPEHDAFKQELFEQVALSLSEICDATSSAYSLSLNKNDNEINAEVTAEASLLLEEVLTANLHSFVEACNQHAFENGHNVSFCIEKHDDLFAINISCKEVEPQPTYWQSIKSGVSNAATVVVTKTKNAAYAVKETTKNGIHAVAETVSDITE